MTNKMQLLLIDTLTEMSRNLRRSHVRESVITSAVKDTAANLFGNDYAAIVDAVLINTTTLGCSMHRGTPTMACGDCGGYAE